MLAVERSYVEFAGSRLIWVLCVGQQGLQFMKAFGLTILNTKRDSLCFRDGYQLGSDIIVPYSEDYNRLDSIPGKGWRRTYPLRCRL